MSLKIAIVGSRTFTDYTLMCDMLKDYRGVNNGGKIELIVSGGAQGADTLAARFAKENNIPFQLYPPNWAKYGKAAGPIRNKQIVEAVDLVIAFHQGNSSGTANTIKLAKEKKKMLMIISVYFFFNVTYPSISSSKEESLNFKS